MAEEMKPTFWNTKSENVCAFCKKHNLWLTPKQMKKRECLCRHCDALSPLVSHSYWKYREARKENRKLRKARLEAQYLEVTSKRTSYEVRT